MMKTIFTLSILLFILPVFAQQTPQQIRKYRISKITRSSVTKGDETVNRTETWYDAYGNDTAEYNNGELYRRTKFEYNEKGLVVSRTRYDAEGNETESASYVYQPDGSYTISNTDKSFGMTDLTYCDKKGNITRTVSADRSERIYSYDAKGHLLKIKSKPGDNGGVIVDQQYTYNTAGQLVKIVSRGDYKWSQQLTYNAKGLVVKTKNNSMTDGVTDPEITTTFEYEFRK